MKHYIFLLWASIREVTQSFASSASVFLEQGHSALVCPPCCRGLGRLFFINRLRNHVSLTSQGVLKCDFGLIRDKNERYSFWPQRYIHEDNLQNGYDI